MKRFRLALALLMLVGLACGVEDISPEYFCEMKGGTWHKSTEFEDAYCENASPRPDTQTEDETGESSTQPAGDSQDAAATENYIPPTPASAQACNATLYIQTQVEVIETINEQYYRECEYQLTARNTHPSESVWIVRRTNTSIHSNATNFDNSYWYSEMLIPDQRWEKHFTSSYFNDGQSSREGVDKIAGVLNRTECLYLLNSPEVESISVPVEWACAP